MIRYRRALLLGVAIAMCLLIGQIGLTGWPTYTVISSTYKARGSVQIKTDDLRSLEASMKHFLSSKPPSTNPVTISLDIGTKSNKNVSSNQTVTIMKVTTNQSVHQKNIGTGKVVELPLSDREWVKKPTKKNRGGGILSPEQTLRILGNTIASLPVVPTTKVIRVIVVTYFRSGSTFLGDVLQQNWKSYYHFEPLHYMSDGLRIKANQSEEALSLINDVFRCNFSTPLAKKYLNWAEDPKHMFLFKRNRFLWIACRMQPKSCFRPDFAQYVCERSPVQVMKVTRLHLDDVLKLAKKNEDLDLRVVHLVRDPRGTISSRKVLDWCNTTSCSDFRVLCNEMNSDYDAFQELKSFRDNRFFQVRYEDLSLHPEPVSRQLFQRLGLAYSTVISKFLRVNTRARAIDEKDPYSTRRNSSRTAFEWRKKLSLDKIRKMQTGICSRVLKNYRYAFINTADQLTGDPPLLPPANSSWT